jgi:hypothetical protein
MGLVEAQITLGEINVTDDTAFVIIDPLYVVAGVSRPSRLIWH